ncbi:hypothetical protein Emin_0484 [Elusimicrobium minutum Pei191]|uniref:Uncharacterized protein n=1 Tax=Elusimicrobium minutum (strain Pei191) TaxID=445932 RepID=B2KCB9_ELUMP|nr:hypothetical protein [Elusimicrobium minutum]ACC98040.1 hypothetical protein Emin_0484 [Elusimicrobium minutum Pei191]
MKNTFVVLVSAVLFLSGNIWAAESMEMVTYYPTPYASYSNVQVNDAKVNPADAAGAKVKLKTADIGVLQVNENLTSDIKKVQAQATKTGKSAAATGTLQVEGEYLKIASGGIPQAQAVNITNSATGNAYAANTIMLGTGTGAKVFPYAKAAVPGASNMVWRSITYYIDPSDPSKGKDTKTFLVIDQGDVTGDCKESYGNWITTTSSTVDTCNGKTAEQYTCAGTAKSNCVDVFSSIVDSTTDFTYSTPVLKGLQTLEVGQPSDSAIYFNNACTALHSSITNDGDPAGLMTTTFLKLYKMQGGTSYDDITISTSEVWSKMKSKGAQAACELIAGGSMAMEIPTPSTANSVCAILQHRETYIGGTKTYYADILYCHYETKKTSVKETIYKARNITCCASASCSAPQVDVNGTCKTPCSNFWTTTTDWRGVVKTTCKFDLDATPNLSCKYEEDCACCNAPDICNADRTIVSASAVCSKYGSGSAQCICANGNQKQCAGIIYPSGADETKCIQSGYYSPYCSCSNFNDYWSPSRPNWQDMACIGLPARCTSEGTNG